MRSGLDAVTSDELRRLLEGGAAANAALRSALESSLHVTFASMFAVAALVALTAALVPRWCSRRGARRRNEIAAMIGDGKKRGELTQLESLRQGAASH